MRYFLFLGILPLFGTALAAAVPAITSSTPTGASLIPRAGSSTSSPLPTCQPYATPGKYGHVPPSACNALYEYNPTLGAPAAVAVIFGLIFIAHVVQGVVYRTLFACVVAMGASWECGGYIAMAYGSRNQQDENVLTAYTVLTYLAPLWVNAFAYMVLGRLIYFYHPRRKVFGIKPQNLATIFVFLDIASFFVQLVGAVMLTPGSSTSTKNAGKDVYLAGMAIQQTFIFFFLFLAVVFHRQMLQVEREARKGIGMVLHVDKRTWHMPLFTLYLSLIAITTRILFRLSTNARDIEGASDPTINHVWYTYVFDALPMMIALLVWNFCYPGRYLRGPDAKLPPSWLSMHLCYCCPCGRGHRQKFEVSLPDRMGTGRSLAPGSDGEAQSEERNEGVGMESLPTSYP